MARSKSSSAWLKRHVSDPYVRKASAQGYRARSAFKLLEIVQREGLALIGQTVVDLGAAPGGWSQVLAQRVGGSGKVIALDLLEVDLIAEERAPGLTQRLPLRHPRDGLRGPIERRDPPLRVDGDEPRTHRLEDEIPEGLEIGEVPALALEALLGEVVAFGQ